MTETNGAPDPAPTAELWHTIDEDLRTQIRTRA